MGFFECVMSRTPSSTAPTKRSWTANDTSPMPQFVQDCKTTSFALNPHPLPHLSYHISLLPRDHQRTSGAMSKEKTVWKHMPSPKIRPTSTSALPSLIVSSVATRSQITLKGTAPCGSTADGASALTILTITAPPLITNVSKTPVSSLSGTQWSAITAQSTLRKTHIS